jgi:hypothetical protein
MGASIGTLTHSLHFYNTNKYKNIKLRANEFNVKISLFSTITLPNFKNVTLALNKEGIKIEKNDIILKDIFWKNIYKWSSSKNSITIYINNNDYHNNIIFYSNQINKINKIFRKYKLNI